MLYSEAPAIQKLDQSNTKERILSCAIRLFSTYGHDATSVRMICKESNVNISAISFYFGSKDSLYQYCLQFIAERADKYYDPAYQEAVKALESGSLTKEQAFQASMKIVDAQIIASQTPYYLSSLRLIYWEQNCTVSSDFHPITDMLFEKCEKPLARLIEAVTDRTYAQAIIASRFVNGSIISFGEHAVLVDYSLADASIPKNHTSWIQGDIHCYASALLANVFQLDPTARHTDTSC